MILVYLLVAAILFAVVRSVRKAYLLYKENPYFNDKSNDYTRWEPADIAIAGYVALFLSKEVRLDDRFQALVYAVLKRSDRAVDEKVRRIATVGAPKSDASAADRDIAFLLAAYTPTEAKQNFLNDLYTAGASLKQVSEINNYL